MTTCLGKSCSFGLPRVTFVNCCQFMYSVISFWNVFLFFCLTWSISFSCTAGFTHFVHDFLRSFQTSIDVKTNEMSHLMTKPTKWLCAQRCLRSAWAFAQPDQSHRCPHEETSGAELPVECTAKTLIRLGGCPGWSEFSLGAQIISLVLSWDGSNCILRQPIIFDPEYDKTNKMACAPREAYQPGQRRLVRQ